MTSFLSVFPPYRGGIAKFSEELYRSLSEKTGVRAFNFLKLYPRLLFPGTSQVDQEKKRTVPAEPVFNPYNLLFQKRTAEKLASGEVRNLIYSYWHPFFAVSYHRLLAEVGTKHPEVKRICIAHNVVPHESFPLKRWLAKKLFEVTDLVVLLSNQTESQYDQLEIDTPHKKFFHPVYPLPKPGLTESELRNKYGFDDSDHILLFFGLVREYKGVDLMIEALNGLELEKNGIRPVIAGEFYIDKEKILDTIRPAHKSFYTVIDRFITENEMSELFTISDLMILPYRKASQSGVLANAIEFQLPALVSDLPGLSEHLVDKENGLIFKNGNAISLRSRILEFLEENLAEKLRQNLSSLREQLDWDQFTRKLMRELET